MVLTGYMQKVGTLVLWRQHIRIRLAGKVMMNNYRRCESSGLQGWVYQSKNIPETQPQDRVNEMKSSTSETLLTTASFIPLAINTMFIPKISSYADCFYSDRVKEVDMIKTE